MHVTKQIKAVLEGPGFALVGIDDHHARPRLAQHRAPFPPGRKAGAAKSAQTGIIERLENILLFDPSCAKVTEQLVSAILHIGVVIDIARNDRIGLAPRGGRENLGGGCVENVAVTDLGDRRIVAEADAGRAHHADRGASLALQVLQQLFAAQHRASQGIADADSKRGDVGLALLYHVEMRVEGRGLEHFGEGQLHRVRKGGEMCRRDLVIFVLDQVQMLDQEVAPTRPVAEQQFDLLCGSGVDLAALGSCLRPLPSLARMFERANVVHVSSHRTSRSCSQLRL